jgi:hypothetical protein
MMEGVFRDEDVRRWPLVHIAEEAAALELKVAEALAVCPPARESQHAGRDVHRIDRATTPRRLDRERAGAAAEVDDDVIGADGQLVEKGAILRRAGALVSVVGLDRRRILEIQSDLAQVVVMPVRHDSLVRSSAAASFGRLARSDKRSSHAEATRPACLNSKAV